MPLHLRVDTEPNGVRTLTLDRPERLNAVNPALAESLPQALDEAAADDAVRAVVVTGAGRAFCAGLDLKEPAMADPHDPLAWVGRWVLAVRRCEKPVLAAINGPAVGAGFGLALACDVRLVASTATMAAGYVRRGLSPDAGVSYFLPRHVGAARAADILFTGRDVAAEEAERVGLAIVLPAERFADEVAAYAGRIAAASPTALALTKRLLTQSPDAPLEAQLRSELAYIRRCFATPEVQGAMASFNQRTT
jgi:2-(1,2-epoxy-1,2-dihydrophenyl)acetyl-CoA isomerase